MCSRSGSRRCKSEGRNIASSSNSGSLGLSRQTGKDPALVGLLRVFKDYYPEIIVGDAVRGKASAFKVCHPPVPKYSLL